MHILSKGFRFTINSHHVQYVQMKFCFSESLKEHCEYHFNGNAISLTCTQLLSNFFIDSEFCHNYLHTLYLFECL